MKLNPDVILTIGGGIKSTGGLDGFLARPGVGGAAPARTKRIIDMVTAEFCPMAKYSGSVALAR